MLHTFGNKAHLLEFPILPRGNNLLPLLTVASEETVRMLEKTCCSHYEVVLPFVVQLSMDHKQIDTFLLSRTKKAQKNEKRAMSTVREKDENILAGHSSKWRQCSLGEPVCFLQSQSILISRWVAEGRRELVFYEPASKALSQKAANPVNRCTCRGRTGRGREKIREK